MQCDTNFFAHDVWNQWALREKRLNIIVDYLTDGATSWIETSIGWNPQLACVPDLKPVYCSDLHQHEMCITAISSMHTMTKEWVFSLSRYLQLENGYKGRQKRAARLSRRHRLRIHNLQQRFAAGRYDRDAEGVFSGREQNPSSDYRSSTSTAYAKPYDAVISGYGDSSLINAASSSVMQRQNAPCSCNIGPAGPPGPPGMDGRDGEFFALFTYMRPMVNTAHFDLLYSETEIYSSSKWPLNEKTPFLFPSSHFSKCTKLPW